MITSGRTAWFRGNFLNNFSAAYLLRRFAAATRKLGRRSGELMASFMREDQQRAMAPLLAKLDWLPKVDGKPDLAALGDPAEAARQRAAEAGLGQEEMLRRTVEYLEAASKV